MASELQAGAARCVITPRLGAHMQGYFNDRTADDLYDDLYAKAIVLRNDEVAMAIVVCDLIGCYREHFAIAKARAQALTGIPAENIFFSATHTHYGPTSLDIGGIPHEREYTEWAMERAADAVRLAWNRMRPATVGHASGTCPEETHNRRWRMKDGTVRMNPGYLNPDAVEPAGPADPEVAVAAFVNREDGSPIAVLTNYSLHYVGSPAATTLSANYFGAFDRALQRAAGREFVAAMANGCCGDVNNCDWTRPAPPMPHPHYQVERVANVVASRAYGAWQQIREFDDAPVLGVATETVDFRRREPSPEDLAEAKRLLSTPGEGDLTRRVYALEAVEVAKEPPVRRTPVMGMRIGDLGIVGMPGEMFASYGLAIKAGSPFRRTMTVELANDFLGYCPTDAAIQEGGYETWLCRWAKAAPGTEGQMIGAGLRVLNRLAEG